MPACSRDASPPAQELYIISPHAADIRREFQTAFSAWHQQHYGTPVSLQWPDIGGGGTANVIKALEEIYAHRQRCDYDLAFGGGSASFNQFRQHGFLVKPPASADAALAAVPHDIFGIPLHGDGDAWIASTMSQFGIIYNKDRVTELHLDPPHTWEDIAGAPWIGRLSLADPAKSGSVRTSYEMILQQYGWERGWAVLTRLFANACLIREAGANPGDDVGSADAVAGIVIDFYGRKQVVRVGPSIAAFIVPEGGSTLDPDPIAMLKGAPHPELAAHFIEFVISPEGQRLWTFRAGTPGGPATHTLGRLSILPGLYQTESQYMLDPANPFAAARPFEVNSRALAARNRFIGDLIKSAMIDNQAELAAARRAVRAAGDPPAMLAAFDALPTFSPSTVSTSGQITYAKERPVTSADLAAVGDEFAPADAMKAQAADRLQSTLKTHWRDEFRERYGSVEKAAQARR